MELDNEYLIYAPGQWECPKCKFYQVMNILAVNQGMVAADTKIADPCPNDGELMRRVTWKEICASQDKFCKDKAEENYSLRAKVEELELGIKKYAMHGEDCVPPGFKHEQIGMCACGLKTMLDNLSTPTEARKPDGGE